MTRVLALSVRQPWAWAILHAGKDIENRDWKTTMRGPFLVHASKGCTQAEYVDAIDFIHEILVEQEKPICVPPLEELTRGGIVGRVQIIDCVSDSLTVAGKHDSPWFVGKYGFVLQNAKPLPFVPMKGALGFFEVPPAICCEIRRLQERAQ